ncbi:uncharacterized protein LOC126188989 [Schistocerca cancellata]|uniref:uncharacterized protein LOC126188989 n=1 Tax=Schistocerca cancellata TaxID=274614 RepID=UPI0021173551|nr:uncharacterized protein LOC126188989 [Schistocerca cancellata]
MSFAMASASIATVVFIVAIAVVTTSCNDWPFSTNVACENDDGFPPVCIEPCARRGFELARCVNRECRCNTDAVDTNEPCSASDGHPSPCRGFCMKLLNYSRASCVNDRCRCLP